MTALTKARLLITKHSLVFILVLSSFYSNQTASAQQKTQNQASVGTTQPDSASAESKEQPGKPKTLVLHIQQNNSLISILKAQVIEASFKFENYSPKEQALKINFIDANKILLSSMYVKPIANDILQSAKPFDFALRLPLPAHTRYLELLDLRVAPVSSGSAGEENWIDLLPLLQTQLSILDAISTKPSIATKASDSLPNENKEQQQISPQNSEKKPQQNIDKKKKEQN